MGTAGDPPNSSSIDDTSTSNLNHAAEFLPIPILLLKTPSPIPAQDPYSVLLSSIVTTNPTISSYPKQQVFAPTFHPVLTHTFPAAPLATLRSLLSPPSNLREKYGGLIFTSQRAVEGFGRILDERSDENSRGSGSTRGEYSRVPDVLIEPTKECSGMREGSLSEADKSNAPAASPSLFPIFVVGKATATAVSRALAAATPSSFLPYEILGQDTGNGSALASFILQYYHLDPVTTTLPNLPLEEATSISTSTSISPAVLTPKISSPLLPLLFPTGEQRRDIIPRTLSPAGLPVHELVLYATTEREDFAAEFDAVLNAASLSLTSSPPGSTLPILSYRPDQTGTTPLNHTTRTRWIIVFSPQGTTAMLRALGLLDEATSRVKRGLETSSERTEAARRQQQKKSPQISGTAVPSTTIAMTTHLMSIGPTTRDFLKERFGFEVDVCAEQPSPEGVRDGILDFEGRRGNVLIN